MWLVEEIFLDSVEGFVVLLLQPLLLEEIPAWPFLRLDHVLPLRRLEIGHQTPPLGAPLPLEMKNFSFY